MELAALEAARRGQATGGGALGFEEARARRGEAGGEGAQGARGNRAGEGEGGSAGEDGPIRAHRGAGGRAGGAPREPRIAAWSPTSFDAPSSSRSRDSTVSGAPSPRLPTSTSSSQGPPSVEDGLRTGRRRGRSGRRPAGNCPSDPGQRHTLAGRQRSRSHIASGDACQLCAARCPTASSAMTGAWSLSRRPWSSRSSHPVRYSQRRVSKSPVAKT
jgi:hypothetical protein